MNIDAIIRYSAETLLHLKPLMSYQEIEARKSEVKNYLLNIYIEQVEEETGFFTLYEPIFFTMMCLQYYSEENELYFEKNFHDGAEAILHFKKYTTEENSYTFVTQCISEAFEKNFRLCVVIEERLEKMRNSIYKMNKCNLSLEQSQKLVFGLYCTQNTFEDHGVGKDLYISLN